MRSRRRRTRTVAAVRSGGSVPWTGGGWSVGLRRHTDSFRRAAVLQEPPINCGRIEVWATADLHHRHPASDVSTQCSPAQRQRSSQVALATKTAVADVADRRDPISRPGICWNAYVHLQLARSLTVADAQTEAGRQLGQFHFGFAPGAAALPALQGRSGQRAGGSAGEA